MAGKTTIYHGSQMIVEKPEYGKGNPRNDYGRGFYCTQQIELAKEWACAEELSGYANIYELDSAGLNIMHLSGADYNILNWVSILLANRVFRISNGVAAEGKKYMLDTFLPDIQPFDVIVGYRADDSYFSFAEDFLNNTISLRQLEKAMYPGQLGEQTVLKSPRSFERIRFVRSEVADRELYYPKRNVRDRAARADYKTEQESEKLAESIYLIDILRERWKADDARIRRNLPA